MEIESIVHSASRWTEQDIQNWKNIVILLEGEGSEEEKVNMIRISKIKLRNVGKSIDDHHFKFSFLHHSAHY